ncbi:MAG: ribosome recycling factor [Bifidobacteriaceae bacterium]|jgi:ribosome recycling factor|nr:ribosome recycling factor [Bifidobacteriaceae bacterium]
MIADLLKEAGRRMDRSVENAAGEFQAIRTGRANKSLFDRIEVDYYGTPTPLQSLASISVREARTVAITPYDRSALAVIEKAIRNSDLGVNPSDDGGVIMINLPELTAERRKEYVKLARSRAEEGRVSVRQARHKAKDRLTRVLKDGEIGEDDARHAEKELDSMTKARIAKIDSLLAHKEAELLEV